MGLPALWDGPPGPSESDSKKIPFVIPVVRASRPCGMGLPARPSLTPRNSPLQFLWDGPPGPSESDSKKLPFAISVGWASRPVRV
jgi:hypothetical protein